MSGVGSKWKDKGGILTQKPRGVCLLVVLFLAECVVWVEGDPGGGAPPFLLTESEEPAAPPAGWVCSTCGRGYASLAELRAHWSEHARGRHVCGVCGASYSVQSSLARHIRTDHAQRRKVFACPLCGSTFKHNFSRNLHLRTVHRLDIPNTKRGDGLELVKCPYCPRSYRHQNNLRTHIRCFHKGVRIPCPICHRGFTRWFTVRCHIAREHQNVDFSRPEALPAQLRRALYPPYPE
ncbi:Zinc finger and BTB domain-containing protein 49 [Portunus trituberculatus]|uniref:Zinc finger and BTB domain-containing protein 49 n=1 Tax=Portunus trituberculatus TaxID=210409 RepID=A0A5B7CM31_PORTR|nr:Zinc finger and BTB domain-containing protein 49 [Portunus trituberculatus]